MFWGASIEEGTLYSIKPKDGSTLYITSATLDNSSSKTKLTEVQLWMQNAEIKHLFGCVSKQTPFIPLNMQISSYDDWDCYSKGIGTVYLSGYTCASIVPDFVSHRTDDTLIGTVEDLVHSLENGTSPKGNKKKTYYHATY